MKIRSVVLDLVRGTASVWRGDRCRVHIPRLYTFNRLLDALYSESWVGIPHGWSDLNCEISFHPAHVVFCEYQPLEAA